MRIPTTYVSDGYYEWRDSSYSDTGTSRSEQPSTQTHDWSRGTSIADDVRTITFDDGYQLILPFVSRQTLGDGTCIDIYSASGSFAEPFYPQTLLDLSSFEASPDFMGLYAYTTSTTAITIMIQYESDSHTPVLQTTTRYGQRVHATGTVSYDEDTLIDAAGMSGYDNVELTYMNFSNAKATPNDSTWDWGPVYVSRDSDTKVITLSTSAPSLYWSETSSASYFIQLTSDVTYGGTYTTTVSDPGPYSFTITGTLPYANDRNISIRKIIASRGSIESYSLDSSTTSRNYTVTGTASEPSVTISISLTYQYRNYVSTGHYEYKVKLNGVEPSSRRYIRLNGSLIQAKG